MIENLKKPYKIKGRRNYVNDRDRQICDASCMYLSLLVQKRLVLASSL